MKLSPKEIEMLPNHIVVVLDDSHETHVRLSKESAIQLLEGLTQTIRSFIEQDSQKANQKSIYYCPYRESNVVMDNEKCILIK